MINNILQLASLPTIVAALLAAILIFLLVKPLLNARHRRNISRSMVLLEKLRGFDGPSREPRIIGYLRKIDPYLFEELLLSAFESCGYKVARGTSYSGDGGIDGHVFVGKKKIPVQAKRYRGHISNKHVEDFAAHASNAGLGLFIHTGRTGQGARDVARQHPAIRFISGQKLVELIDGKDPLSGFAAENE